MGTKFSYQTINVKLCYRNVNGKSFYHVIIPEGERFSWNDFVKLKDYLRSKFSNNFNKTLYLAGTPRWHDGGKVSYVKDQPVFEYLCTAKELITEIDLFAKNQLSLGEFQFAFATVDYDFVASMKEVPLDVLMQAGETFSDFN